ncbi:uncharacterized protein LOC132729983 [Ruditapes philippinarum]|uniref:uncharacterized protein LOC132729983 n=1 Tax=Ruditapes philippinarum TaxID=129788 RepID=UPI00295C0E53|nr:uncharacterized protein LOC132729983 [Ruditapes philippinarum]
MMRAYVFFLVFSVCVALSGGACPVEMCTADLKPARCRSVSFFVHDGEVCQSCDLCVEKSKNLVDGCPLRPCNRMAIPDRCRRDVYYVYQGRNICQDCPRNACQF